MVYMSFIIDKILQQVTIYIFLENFEGQFCGEKDMDRNEPIL